MARLHLTKMLTTYPSIGPIAQGLFAVALLFVIPVIAAQFLWGSYPRGSLSRWVFGLVAAAFLALWYYKFWGGILDAIVGVFKDHAGASSGILSFFTMIFAVIITILGFIIPILLIWVALAIRSNRSIAAGFGRTFREVLLCSSDEPYFFGFLLSLITTAMTTTIAIAPIAASIVTSIPWPVAASESMAVIANPTSLPSIEFSLILRSGLSSWSTSMSFDPPTVKLNRYGCTLWLYPARHCLMRCATLRSLSRIRFFSI